MNNKYDLSVLIPARNEMFLALTVENILKNIRGKTEILVLLDGQWASPGVPDDPRVTVVYVNEAVGQRAGLNLLARISQAKYLFKIDAHCLVDEGFDVKLMADMQDDWTVVPTMYNLHMFDWVCSECGYRKYQSPTPKECDKCKAKDTMKREIIAKRREGRRSNFYRFDKTLHFQYFGEFGNRPEGKPDIAPTMSLQGSAFMLTRDKWFELNICDEAHGSWGQQGVEVACKTWFSGGQVMVNKKTWYAHMFRTQGGDFGFPFPLSGSDVDKARKYSRKLFLDGEFKGVRDLDWLLEKFKPVPDWHFDPKKRKKLAKGIVYYTNNEGDELILEKCRKQILKGMKSKHIVSSSLKPIDFGKNIVFNLTSGYLTMTTQILEALKKSTSDVIFFCEHDVLYHPSHFNFLPYQKDTIYYNTNVWRVRYSDGHSLYCDNLQQLSGLVAHRDVLIKHYTKREELLKNYIVNNGYEDFSSYVRAMGFEPGTHNRNERVDDLKADSYKSECPNIDLRHDFNLTSSRWHKDQFRNQKYTKGWTEKHFTELKGWDDLKHNTVRELLALI